MNRKILTSGVSILAALGLMAGGTFAFFSDAGSSTNNVFASGTLNLVLTDSDESALDNVTASFGGSAMAPGQCLAPATLNLRNDGTVAGDHAQIAFSNSNGPLSLALEVQSLTYDGIPVVVPDSNVNSYVDFNDLAANGLDNLPLTDLGNSHPLTMTVCLDDLAGNSIQGQSNTVDLTVTLNQDASQ